AHARGRPGRVPPSLPRPRRPLAGCGLSRHRLRELAIALHRSQHPPPDEQQGATDMNTAILLYDRFTALDAIGPYEVLSRLPGASVTFVAAERGPVTTDNGMLTIVAERSIDELDRPDIVLVPGGPGEVAARAGGPALEWLRGVHETSEWTTSVCTGSLILAAAGLLEGKRPTSHWWAREKLRELGAQPVSERVVFEGKIVTAAGVSAGLDMALALAARIAG